MSTEKLKGKRKNTSNKYMKILILIVATLSLIGIWVAVVVCRFRTQHLKLENVQAVTIQDIWGGLSPVAPIIANYHLLMQDGSLIGEAQLSVGYLPATHLDSIVIPPDVVDAFLTKLEQAALKEGEYTPFIQRTDDYPSIVIRIDMPTYTVEIYSRSQGAEHRPWGATVRDTTYLIDSGIPAEALTILSPYLHKDVLQDMVNDALGRP